MDVIAHNPHFVTEPAYWDASKKQYRVIEYGQTVALVSRKRQAVTAIRTARHQSTSAAFRRSRKGL